MGLEAQYLTHDDDDDVQVAYTGKLVLADSTVVVGLNPIVTLQYSSTTLYQLSYHIQ